jgi:hypothetical protein
VEAEVTHKTIAVSLLLLIGCGVAQAPAKDGFERVRCNADIAKALIGQRAANERIVVIEARHKDLGLKDLGSNERSARLKDKIATLREQMRKYKTLEAAVHAAPDKQISLTDPDARSMATSGKDTGLVGYNVQAAVDTQHHLIVAHEVTNIGNDTAVSSRRWPGKPKRRRACAN